MLFLRSPFSVHSHSVYATWFTVVCTCLKADLYSRSTIKHGYRLVAWATCMAIGCTDTYMNSTIQHNLIHHYFIPVHLSCLHVLLLLLDVTLPHFITVQPGCCTGLGMIEVARELSASLPRGVWGSNAPLGMLGEIRYSEVNSGCLSSIIFIWNGPGSCRF